MAYATDAARWRALATRDANANGHFIYSVKSTNIYCRPTCPGRLARRANVGFYSTPFEAEAAGFRACKRCRPNTVLEDPKERAVEKARSLIDEALNKDDQKSLKLQDIAKKINLTPRYFHKIFKDKTGLTPKKYAKKRAADRNSLSAISISAIATDESTQSWDWDAFDFSSLIDLETDSSPISMDNFVVPEEQPPTMYANLNFDAVGLSQPCAVENETNQASPWYLDFHNLIDPFYDVPAQIYHYEKTMPSTSTFETDAVALFECDNPKGFLQVW